MTRAPALAAALAAVLLFVAVAAAKTVDDGNDTKGRIDIKSATFSKTSDGKLRFVVKFFSNVPKEGETGNEYINVWKSKPHVMEGCGGCFKEAPYKMQGPQTGKRDVFKGGEDETPYKKTGSGTIKRKGKTLTFIAPRKAFGKPKHRIFWRISAYYYGSSDECPSFDDCVDYAPNAPKLVKQPL